MGIYLYKNDVDTNVAEFIYKPRFTLRNLYK